MNDAMVETRPVEGSTDLTMQGGSPVLKKISPVGLAGAAGAAEMDGAAAAPVEVVAEGGPPLVVVELHAATRAPTATPPMRRSHTPIPNPFSDRAAFARRFCGCYLDW